MLNDFLRQTRESYLGGVKQNQIRQGAYIYSKQSRVHVAMKRPDISLPFLDVHGSSYETSQVAPDINEIWVLSPGSLAQGGG
jgi:hypothetical protein